MEKLRTKIDDGVYHDLQPLGRSKLHRGKVSEDLGRTEFKANSTTKSRKCSKHSKPSLPANYDSIDNIDYEDEMDILKFGSFPPTLPPTAHKKSKAPKMACTESHVTPPRSRSMVKPRPNFRGVNPPDLKLENETDSSLKQIHYPSISFSGNPMPPSNQLALRRPHKSPSHENGTSPLEELNPNRVKRPKALKGKRGPESFLMHADCPATNPALKSRSPTQSRRDAAPFPMSVSLGRSLPQFRQDPAPFPMAISPARSPRRRAQPGLLTTSQPKTQDPGSKENMTRALQRFPLDNSSTRVIPLSPSDEDDENDELALTDNDDKAILAYGGPRPFPMGMSQCVLQPTYQSSGSKRFANINDEQRAYKRSRRSPEPNTFDVFRSLSIEGDSQVDSAALCPYCDEPWPSSPSPTLLSLLERTKRKSYTDPRPGNVLGLKAPLAVFIEVCQRHRFEMTHLPLALERGWPTRLDFASLPTRITGFRCKLGRFIDHPNESQFWREVRDDVKKVGRMKVVSVSGQYATFERTQPGYYGEQGSIIIHQTLYSLFPPDEIPSTFVDPLTPDQFLTHVLVPETAVLLIREDMHLPTKDEALRVLDESKKYGVAMFPEQAQGAEAAEVGEQLARERARERRKLLEERGEADADVQRQVDRERHMARKAKGKNKDHRATKKKSRESGSDADSRNDKGKELRKGMRKAEQVSDSGNSAIQVRPMRLKKSGGVSMQLTLRPLKEQSRESSIISWRSKRSPSTSPDTRPAMATSPASSVYASCRKPISSPPNPPTQDSHQGSEWVFDLQNISSSPDHGDEDFDEISSRVKGNSKGRGTANSDSDVMVIEDDLTSTPRPKQKASRIAQRSIINALSDSEVNPQSAASKPKATHQQKIEKSRNKTVGVAPGQTKRKRKGTTKHKVVTSGGSSHP